MSVTKLLQCLRDELVRRDYAATTIRSHVQIVDAFRQNTGARLNRITPAQLRRYHEGNFFALDAETGKPLCDTQCGGVVGSDLVSFAVDGKLYVATAAGFGIFVLGLR